MNSSKEQKRREKMERREQERRFQAAADAKATFFKRIGVGIGLIVLVFAGGWAFQAGLLGSAAENHPYAEFAQCLADEGFVMYGTDWCPHCQDQKKMFGDAFEFIEYVNCDFNQSVCEEKGVTGYPTWHLNDQLWDSGVQNFNEFAQASTCPLPEGF